MAKNDSKQKGFAACEFGFYMNFNNSKWRYTLSGDLLYNHRTIWALEVLDHSFERFH